MPGRDEPAPRPKSANERSVSRRAILRGMASTGVAGALAGCTDVVDQNFEAAPVNLDESRATFLGFQPEPIESTTTVGGGGEATSNVLPSVRLTTRTRVWSYASGFAEGPGTGSGTGSWKMPACDDDIVIGDGPLGGPRQGPVDGTGPTVRDAGELGLLGDGLVVRSLPDPGVAGVSLNPVARNDLVELARSHTEEFQRLCHCEFDAPGSVEVRTVSNRGQIRPADVGEVVFLIDDLGGLDLPTQVELLDGRRPLRAFVFATEAELEGLVATVVLATKAEYNASATGQDVAIAAYLGRVRRPELERPRPLVGDGGLVNPARLEAYLDRFAVACPCMESSGSPEGGGPDPDTAPATGGRTRGSSGQINLRPAKLSESRTQRLWEQVAGTSEAATVESVLSDSFGLDVDQTDLAGYRITEQGIGSYVVRAPLTGGTDDLRDQFFAAYFDEGRTLQMAGMTVTQIEPDGHLLVQSFAPVDGDRHDRYATIETGRIQTIKGRTGATHSDLLPAIRRDQQGTRSGRGGGDDDPYWLDVLEKIGCRFCDLGITVIEAIIKNHGCTIVGYTLATGSLASLSGNPSGASGGWILMKALCKQLMSKSIDTWLVPTADCCLCFEIGLCERSHCEALHEDGLMSKCGCCSCDDDGGDGGSSGTGGSGGSGGTGTAW